MKNIYTLVITIFLSIFLTSNISADEKLDKISLKSAVVFNTLCSKCHEGQCSGRLTFDTGSDAASNHIKRYCDDATLSTCEVKEYFTLLNYMKKECLLFMPKNIKYDGKNLLTFATSSRQRYFIPLGLLKKGEYKLLISNKEDLPYRVEIISSQFDAYLDRSICSSIKTKEFEFSIDEKINYYIRISSKKAIIFESLEIVKD